ncbi:glycosyltransferase, partial [bacterium]|nr:glycosyltransferase [bacterium]
RYLIKKLFPKADVVIGVSKHVMDDTIELCNKLETTLIIYNPIDINNINNIKNDSTGRFSFNKDKKYLIFVGRLDKIKRIDDILKILANLESTIELIILGDGILKSTLQKQSKILNVNKRVHFLGRVENPYKYIEKSDILLLTSESESFGNVIIESFVCKTPVISTKCGGPEELISNKNGILVDVGDLISIKENIYKLLEDKSFRDNIILNAEKRSEMFKLDTIMIKYKEVLCVE